MNVVLDITYKKFFRRKCLQLFNDIEKSNNSLRHREQVILKLEMRRLSGL